MAAHAAHLAEVERGAIERLAIEKAVEWAKMTEAVRREAWQEAERAIAMVREARRAVGGDGPDAWLRGDGADAGAGVQAGAVRGRDADARSRR